MTAGGERRSQTAVGSGGRGGATGAKQDHDLEGRDSELPGEPLERIGQPPDPRFTFANERTFLAWNRTALALIAAGLAASQLLDFEPRWLRLVIGLPLIVLGAVTAVSSYRLWHHNERAMRLGQPLRYSPLSRPLAVAIALVAVAAVALAVIDAAR